MQVEEFQVLQIIQKRTVTRGNSESIEYKVLWKGYTAADATWEPLENMQGCLKLIQEFEQKQKKKKDEQLTSAKGKMHKPKTSHRQINVPQYDYVKTYQNDLYFSDESDQPHQKYNPHEGELLQLQPNQEAPIHQLQRSDLKPTSEAKEQKKQQKKKKDLLAMSREKMDIEHKPAQQAMQKNGLMFYKRRPEDQLTILAPLEEQSSAREKHQTVQIQTDSPEILPSFDPPLKIISMHSSKQFPGKIWFTVSSGTCFSELPLEKLYQVDPKALYSFYHQHYLTSRTKAGEARQLAEQMMQEQMIAEEESSAEEDSLHYSDIVSINNNPYSRQKLQNYVRQEAKRRLNESNLQKSLRK